MSEWISVKDLLPGSCVDVLLLIPKKEDYVRIVVGFFSYDFRDNEAGFYINSAYRDPEDNEVEENYIFIKNKPICWAKLPEIPDGLD